MKSKVFFFVSSRGCDILGGTVVTIVARSYEKAVQLASRKFIEWGYKGSPKLAI